MIMNEAPEISTYMDPWFLDSQYARIEIYTGQEIINGKKIFNTTVWGSKVHDLDTLVKKKIAEYPLVDMPEHSVLKRHEITVEERIKEGYKATDLYYSTGFENIKLGEILEGVEIPDKIV